MSGTSLLQFCHRSCRVSGRGSSHAKSKVHTSCNSNLAGSTAGVYQPLVSNVLAMADEILLLVSNRYCELKCINSPE